MKDAAALLIHRDWREVSQQMSEYLKLLTGVDDFSGAVLVGYGNEVVFERASGLADVKNHVAVTPDTIFRIGSLTKPITAVAVLQLHDEAVLSIAEYASDHVDGLPASWAEITIHQLLTHTSGIPSYTHLPEYPASMTVPSTPEAILERVKHLPLQFRPGDSFAYSNSGYVLLGLLLERLSGKPYAELLQDKIFNVLKLLDTGAELPSAMLRRMAQGYESEAGELIMAPCIDMSVPHAAGALYSTVEDLRRFTLGVFGGKLLSPATLHKMLVPARDHYACGWFIGEYNHHRMVWHSGGIGGFSSHLTYFPDRRLTVVVLSNHADGMADAAARALASIGLHEPYVLPHRRVIARTSADLLPGYEGVYEMDKGIKLTVTVEKGKLYVQATGQERFLAQPLSRTNFFLRALNAELTFADDEDGRPRLILRQYDKEFLARKLS